MRGETKEFVGSEERKKEKMVMLKKGRKGHAERKKKNERK